MKTLGWTLLAAAWAVVLIGMLNKNYQFPWFGKSLSISYIGVPLLAGALFVLLRTAARERSEE